MKGSKSTILITIQALHDSRIKRRPINHCLGPENSQLYNEPVQALHSVNGVTTEASYPCEKLTKDANELLQHIKQCEVSRTSGTISIHRAT